MHKRKGDDDSGHMENPDQKVPKLFSSFAGFGFLSARFQIPTFQRRRENGIKEKRQGFLPWRLDWLLGVRERNGDHGFALTFLSSLFNDDDDDAKIQSQVYFNF